MPAGADQKPKQLYEFGPFRVDPAKELLLRGEATVPLTPKTFQILLVLMRHSKEVVTKDELMKMIWPDTFVEETNLSRNIFLLRKALGESPQDHQYIVTVPGRGYRFAEDVRLVTDQELSIVATSHAKVQVEIKETKPWPWVAVAAVLLIGVSIGVFTLLLRKSHMLTDKDTVVLADFSNSTGDPVFDGTLRQGLAVQLEQSPFLSLVSDQRIQRTLRLMNQPADARITGQTAQEICERTGSAAVLEGSISSLGTQYVLGLRATSCRTGETLDEEQAQAARKEDVLNALGQMANKFRTRIGESLTSVEKYSTPLEEATTSSLDALKAYSTGVKVAFTSGFAAGVPFLKRAVELDSQFAMAYAHMGLWYSSIGESGLAMESTRKAYELRDHASDREKFFVTAMYQRDVTGDLEAAYRTLELWTETYPRDLYVHGFLAGFIAQGTGRYEQSIQEAEKALALDPDFTPAYINLGFSHFYLDQVNEAESPIKRASGRKLQVAELLMLRYYVAFLKGDEAGMLQASALAKDIPGAQDWMSYSEALTSARSGKFQMAKAMCRLAMDQAREAGQLERAATYETGEADWEALTGNSSAATKDAAAALKISRGRDVEYAAAFALAIAGDYSRARSIANDLEKRFPEDTSVKFNYLPALHGFFALHDGSPEHAIELLQPAVAYEFAVPSVDFNTFFGGLNPIWVRAEAYLAEHKGAEAAVEFQKIIDHKGLLASDPLGALAHFELGRAYAIAGDRTKAKMAFKDFLSLWKDADREIPMLKKAKVEYAKLQQKE
jgi:DNA-binding winged helix-turn-helix (wHTH) protein/tetratricopeptide (TPR) repeat protein